jgi:methylamine dehydrogenase heavy chain
MKHSTRAVALFAVLGVFIATLAHAELKPEPVGISETVPAAEPHWSFYLDFSFQDFTGRFVLIDADTVDYLAHISAGQFPTLAIAPDASEVYVTETTYQYGSRGQRYDFVTVYDTTNFAAQEHIALPTGKRAIMAAKPRTTLLGDARFLAVYNYTPATSVSIVDLKSRKHISETPVPGCHLVYPTGERGVSMLCGDGSMLTLHFDEDGAVTSQTRGEPFFDADADPLKTHGARIGDTWYFVSYSGLVIPVDLSGEAPVFGEPWPVVDRDAEPANLLLTLLTLGKAGPWKPGGMQFLAGHTARNELYVIVHPVFWSGGKGDHDFPGPEIWVFDVETHERLRRIEMDGVAMSMNVTQDTEPLLLVLDVDIDSEEMHLKVYDAVSGDYLREMHEFGDSALGFEPMLGAVPPPAGGTQ